ncbi:MAG TPA: sigma-70 family RNA polymerase sigma factor [Candidatus Acidoferrales bacterium]|nr:sigma-70 family RNA polymerase sigma factor [Candidatus Acidoferrales bacterium]
MVNASRTAPRNVPVDEMRAAWPDVRLVRECLEGREEAWRALIFSYKNLIFSIPLKYGFSADDSTDIFQAVCLDLLSELPKLREAKALPKWIMQITAHKCFHRKQQERRTEVPDSDTKQFEQSTPARAEEILREAEDEQDLRQAMSKLPPRCRQLVYMLFYDEPARPYQDIAKTLGIAVGSIGFIRQRCLERLRKSLLEAGFS